MPAPFVLLRDAPPDGQARWLRFEDPHEQLEARTLDQVQPILRRAEAAADRGAWIAGFLAYEAAPALDPALDAFPVQGAPLAWWGVFDPPRVVDLPPPPSSIPALDWRADLEPAAYRDAIRAIREHIAAGETYQANFTFALETPFPVDDAPLETFADRLSTRSTAERLFAALWHAQRGGYSAFLDLGDRAVVSASPELFLRLDGRRILTRPMKGTARRGRWPAEDEARRAELLSDKNRAENLMIVDMMRNDLGRVAEPGSVRVRRLFEVESYPTVHQLTSEVEARTDAGLVDLLEALFPCASITGAPKASTTAILRRLESAPRGVYTGTIGYVAPDRTAQLSVAIRTAVVDRRQGRARYGVGGGIVWDSEADAELAEARAKALVLQAAPAPPPTLFETILWRPKSGYFLLERHLDRLEASARFFDLPGATTVRERARALLERTADAWSRDASQETVRRRVRLTFDPSRVPGDDPTDDALQIESEPFPCSGRAVWSLALDGPDLDDSQHAVDPEAIGLFHKTTDRARYVEARARHPHADDVLLRNTRGELTESTVANLVIRRGDHHLTPPLDGGLLPGVYRAELLARGRLQEQILRPKDLDDADAIFLINSLRGWIPCRLTSRP